MADDRRVRLRIRGLVQGVFYRESARREATRLGLSGWVRNLEDQSVEAEAQGPAPSVQAFIDWCHRGPPQARVESVAVEALPAQAIPGEEQALPNGPGLFSVRR